jgi:NAD+ kinase
VSGANAPRRVTLFTHRDASDTAAAVEHLTRRARAGDVELIVPEPEARKLGLEAGAGVRVEDEADAATDLGLVLGGDGTILAALRAFAGTDVPVFAINFGAIGFLATVDRDELELGLERALSGDFSTLEVPALAVRMPNGPKRAAGDVSFHRRLDSRVAELSYSVEGEQLGKVRCDGLVAATPVGSTGYNLANGGPLLAWGVEGFVVSFIAPHSLTARAVVVAPETALTVFNCSDREAVDVTTDGRTVGELAPLSEVEVHFEHASVRLAQVPGVGFYRRLREKFGRIAY